ncbi:CHAP domain-containing protein [Latilactobacillus sakei]
MTFKKSIISAVTVSLVGVTIASTQPAFASSSAAAKEAIQKNQDDAKALLKQIAAANEEGIKLDQQIKDNSAKIATQEAAIKEATDEIDNLSTKIDAAKEEVAKRTTVLEGQLISLQKTSGDAVSGNVYVDFILNSDNLTDLVARTFTVNKLNEASKEALADVNESKAKLTDLKDNQEKAKAKLEDDKADLEKQKTNLLDLKDKATKNQNDLTKKINDNKKALTALKADYDKANKAETEKELKELAASAAEGEKGTDSSVGEGKKATSSAGNAYAWGQCTWYVKAVAPWAGNSWGNGNQWGASAAAAGFTVDHNPAAGTIISFAAGQKVGSWAADPSYGHVAYVQSYDADKNTVTISQGGLGFGSPAGPNTQTVSNARSLTYIHK